LEFRDLGDNAPAELHDGLFKPSQAKQIAEFVHKHDGLIVVNCEAGLSRSPGVVLALRRFFGGDTEEVFQKAIRTSSSRRFSRGFCGDRMKIKVEFEVEALPALAGLLNELHIEYGEDDDGRTSAQLSGKYGMKNRMEACNAFGYFKDGVEAPAERLTKSSPTI
jgi:hypothetical protein